MQTISRFAIAYALNSFWLLPLLFLGAEIIARVLGRTRGGILCCVWWVALILALVVPTLGFVSLPFRSLNAPSSMRSVVPQTHGVAIPDKREPLHFGFSQQRPETTKQIDRSPSWIPGIVLTCTFYFYLGSILIALARLGRGLWETHVLMRSARDLRLTDELLSSWESCKRSLGLSDVRLLSSAALSSPAALHWPKPTVLLPSKLRASDSTEMTAVFCHELAHVRRKDFAWNLAIEFFGVLLFYHPAFHWMRRRIQETRELACDDMAADAMRGRHEYARNLLSLTQKMLSDAVIPQPGCALGIFEGEVLERRIMNLLEKRSQYPLLRFVSSSIAGICLIILTCIASTNLGLRLVNAQTTSQTSHAPTGWFMAGNKPANYDTGVDKTTLNNDQPSAFLRSTVPNTEGFGTLMQSINATEYVGKRVRLRAWVKSQDVADWAGVWMRVDKDTAMVAFDNMQNRAIKGTQSWSMHDVVLNVPQGSTGISFGILLAGTGEVWMNDVTFEVVGDSVPVTSITPPSPKVPDHPANLKFTE
ncbi:MAG TPA: M56 family metallopeptidase [Terracidiphilus sp.]|nr:M56 family metallopeptidase [Terracidiphilus sp.]